VRIVPQALWERMHARLCERAHDVSPSIAARLREAEEELSRLETQSSSAPAADIERLIPRLAEEIERAVRELPKTLTAENVDLAREELQGS
jgi:guanylate kinase